MEFTVVTNNTGYAVQDKNRKILYTVRKKTFGKKWNLLDTNKYNLYTLAQMGDERRPLFSIILNDTTFLTLECKSQFLDPSIYAKGKTISYVLSSKDRREFDILVDDKSVGHISTKVGITGELLYDVDIDNKMFDDYICLFAVVIDKTFGEMNKQV